MKKQILRGLGTGLVMVAIIMMIFYMPMSWKWMLDLRHLTVTRVLVVIMSNMPAVVALVLGSNLRIRNK